MNVFRSIKIFLQRLCGLLAQVVAALIIVLALLVGVARLLLPEAAELKEEIRSAVRVSTGFDLDFAMIGAGLSIYGPELRFDDVRLAWPDGTQIAEVKGVAVSLDVITWVTSGTLFPGRVLLEGTAIDIERTAAGDWLVQGRPWGDYVTAERQQNLIDFPETHLQLTDVAFSFVDRQQNRPRVDAIVSHFDAALRDLQVEVSAELYPSAELGRTIALEAELPVRLLLPDEEVDAARSWQLWVYADDLQLDRWLEVAQLKDLPIIDTVGDVVVQLNMEGLRAIEFTTELDLEQLKLQRRGSDSPAILLESLEAELAWRRKKNGWFASGRGVRVERGSTNWLESEYSVDYVEQGVEQKLVASATFLRLEDILPFVEVLAPQQLADAGFAATLAGDLENLSVSLTLVDQKITDFMIDGGFTGLGYAADNVELVATGLSGHVSADNAGGNLKLTTQDARIGYAPIFRDVLDVKTLEGLAIWRAGPDGYRVLADGIQLTTPHARGSASLELTFADGFQNPYIDLTAEASMADALNVPLYLPLIIPPKVLQWLDRSLMGGRVPAADFKLRGPLREFPFDHGEGDFLIHANFEDGKLDYAPDWPGVSQASGMLVFDGVSMYSTSNSLVIADTAISNIDMRMDDMRNGVLNLAGEGDVELNNLLEFLQTSPVGAALGPVFSDVRASGSADATLELSLPFKDLQQWSLESDVRVRDGSGGLSGFADRFTQLSGSAHVSNIDVSIAEMSGQFLGRPVTIQVEPITSATSAFSHRAMVQGYFPVAGIRNLVGLETATYLTGDTNVTAQALFPGGAGGAEPFHLIARSDLVGLSSSLPYPLDKPTDTDEGLQVEVEFPESGITRVYGSLERGLSWALEVQADATPWSITHGAVVRGVDRVAIPAEPGVIIRGEIDSLSLDAWAEKFADEVPAETDLIERRWQHIFRQADLQIGELDAMGHRFVDVDASVGFYKSHWDVQLTGPWTEGRVVLPYDFTGPEPAELDMERLLLIEPLDGGDSEEQLDPRTLPAVRGRISDFAIGALRFGRIDADVVRVRDGLRSRSMVTRSESFNSLIRYDWLVIDKAQRSRLHLELRSTDVEEMLLKLGYSPLIEAERATVIADLLWEGGPSMDAVFASTGSIDLNIRDGLIKDVDAGSGRLLGLLSVTAIPRRFALDFKDVSDDGLVFDKINGKFRIDFGDAWTCNLGLEGSIADMGIVGRAGFQTEDYDQVAAIRPHVSNLAPVAGAFLAGPTIGIATLLVTQILKKPLSSLGESYYTIRGSFDEPQFEKADRQELDTTAFADCESQLPPLSPEELEAIQGLIDGKVPPAEPPVAKAQIDLEQPAIEQQGMPAGTIPAAE